VEIHGNKYMKAVMDRDTKARAGGMPRPRTPKVVSGTKPKQIFGQKVTAPRSASTPPFGNAVIPSRKASIATSKQGTFTKRYKPADRLLGFIKAANDRA
jgi:hypothetical protein